MLKYVNIIEVNQENKLKEWSIWLEKRLNPYTFYAYLQ